MHEVVWSLHGVSPQTQLGELTDQSSPHLPAIREVHPSALRASSAPLQNYMATRVPI